MYLFSAISQKGKEMQVGSLLLNSVIEENSNSKRMLDFEGSMTPSIASFLKVLVPEMKLILYLKNDCYKASKK